MKKIKCIMLIDDNPDDNFYHERVIKKNNAADLVIAKTSALEALEYLSKRGVEEVHPDLIFLDINMPGMNGWEFLNEYNKLSNESQSKVLVIMLTTSENPDDRNKALELNLITDFRTKPLDKQALEEVTHKYF